MRLTELDPRFLRYERRADGVYHVPASSIADAQGIRFLCPKCFRTNGGRVGTHQVICWSRSRGVPDNATPGPGRWKLDGTGPDNLTLNADPPASARSVDLTGACGWHGHVTNGDVTDC